MRIVDPKLAPMIPVETELKWEMGMPINEHKFKMVYWNRELNKFYEYEGVVADIVLREVPGVKDDYDWLRNIGAIDD